MSSDESIQQVGDAQGVSGAQAAAAPEAITFSPDVVNTCQAIVQKFRAGQYGRVQATLEIYSTIPDDGITEEQHYQAVEVYLNMLDNFAEKQKNALARGVQASASRGTHTLDSPDDQQVEAQLDEPPLRQKQPRIVDSDDEDKTGDFHMHGKRPELDLADLPWLLARFAQDPKGVKVSVLNARDCPQFPDSEWTNVIAGRAVNLDHVLTELYNVSVDTKHKERLGAIEFSVGAIAPAKIVKSHGEWDTAWQHTVAATASSWCSELPTMNEFSLSTKPSECESQVGEICDSPMPPIFPTSRCYGSLDLALDPATPSLLERLSDDLELVQLSKSGAMPASDGMMNAAPTLLESATTHTSVPNAGLRGMLPLPAQSTSEEEDSIRAPRHQRGFIWDPDVRSCSSTPAADWSLTAAPLPGPPENELNNIPAQQTLARYPHLFKIVTPINVDKFESLLKDHPNRPFVDSVCRRLREGFWPSADTSDPEYPTTWDNSKRDLASEEHRAFVEEQCQKEIAVGRFSDAWEADELLPGMYSMPIGVAPKPNSDKLRLITDHSAGKFSLNSMIAKPEHDDKVQLDNIHDLGHNLLQVRRSLPHVELDLIKSDVAEAYRLMPMHPSWQIKQVVSVGRKGCLVLWIAVNIRKIKDLLGYSDDTFSWEYRGNSVWYAPYATHLPRKQRDLLRLWDELGIPHRAEKQISGSPIPIIGFEVDANTMSVTLSDERRDKLVSAIRDFAGLSMKKCVRRPLHQFQSLAGWIQWALNVYPLLRPGLSMMYHKMCGKQQRHALIEVSVALRKELHWLADHVERSPGIFMLRSLSWRPEDADLVIFTDACFDGMGFWSQQQSLGFQSRLPPVAGTIFFWECLAVLSAIHWAASNADVAVPQRLVIYCDNTNTVDLFSSLHAQPQYNPLLRSAVDALLWSHIDLRVLHIPGEVNGVADALSRWDIEPPARRAGGAATMNFPTRSTRQPVRERWSRERLLHERAVALGFALKDSSLLSYSSALQSYLAFCEMHQLPVEPTEETLSFYVVYTCHYIRPSSVRNYLSGICQQLEAFFPQVRTVRCSKIVSQTLAGCFRTRAHAPTRKSPLTRAQLAETILSYRQSSSLDDLLFCALMATAFHGLLRLGELVLNDNPCLRDCRTVIERASLQLLPNGYRFLIPSSKTDRVFHGAEIIIAGVTSDDDALAPLTRYLHMRDQLFPFHPHLWLCRSGQGPTRSWFMRRLRSHFPSDITGHSLRAGGATALAEEGVPLDYIQLLGRWTSDTFRIYIRQNLSILCSLLFRSSRSLS
ncbi:hypothetical protein EVG20_g10240 [Dentipellis fragilis]|uniref:Tyr recombinase domain-containing protein n=1 Tax=Dentipellis fragilis TaxID=205917 RepID=A0A4Y9XS72_9AGAM|nr:hypothetical protein EVG20_g10240 [Dentipellis fragilis]